MWNPLNITTHYSTCVGLSKPDEVVKKCVEYGYKSCAITDEGTLAGSISFYESAKKNGIKPIFGTRLNNITFLSKNYKGWQNLIRMTASQNIFDYNEDKSVIAISPRGDEESIYHLKGLFGEDFYFEDEAGFHKQCFYMSPSDKEDYKILMSANTGRPIGDFSKLDLYQQILVENDFSLSTPEEVKDIQSKNQEIVDKCEEYDILGELKLPRFDYPKEFPSEYDYMVHLCRQGWKSKIAGKGLDENVYRDRVKKELEVIKKVGLQGYFLIVQDYVNWAKNQGWLQSTGRGSSAGSLVCYLLNITKIDPIKYNLIFERFYNEGRNTKDRKALPDIDTDFPKFKRDLVIDYIVNKYGQNKVSHIVTYSELKGKSSIKEVLRAHKAVSNDEMNNITKHIPSKEEISDLLAESKEESILKWVLNNEPDILKDWVTIDDNGVVHGELAPFFEQAIRLEGTFIGTGKHASGIIISKEPLSECCPMTKDKDGNSLAALDMSDLEKAGFVKFDILGLAALDKLMGINNLLRYGRINV